jgi:ADP-heptose:LPS heptosyltransferase
VLLVRLRSIGDTVLMTPCLAALKTWRPDLKVYVLSESLASPLLEKHPLIDQLFLAPESTASRLGLISQLRQHSPDVAFNLHGGSTGAILSRLSGATHSIGYKGLSCSWLLSDRAPAPDQILGKKKIHSVEQQLALLRWSGVSAAPSNPALKLEVSSSARERVVQKLIALGLPFSSDSSRGGFACIVPGAAFESKRWRAEGFAEVADYLSQRWGLRSVIVAGPGQESLATRVTNATRTKPVVISGLTLKELEALIEMSFLFVGNDSGPMHIAAAFDRPIVVTWGSSDADVWHPWTVAPWKIVRASSANKEKSADGSHSIKQISSGDVTAAVDEVLQRALDEEQKIDAVNPARRAI